MQFDAAPFTSRERKIVSFIRNNPGLTKNQLRVKLPEMKVGSYVTINKDLNELEKLRVIKFYPEKRKAKNSPIKCYINDYNLLMRLDTELTAIQECFNAVMLKMLQRHFELRPPRSSSDAQVAIKLRNQIIALLNHIIYLYVVYATTVWPLKIYNDIQLFERMLSTTFSRLAVMRQNVLLSLGPGMAISYAGEYQKQVQGMFRKTLDSSIELKKFCTEASLEKELATITRMVYHAW